MPVCAGVGSTGTSSTSRKLRVASIIHYEQAFFIRQIIAACVPIVSLVVRYSLPHVMAAFYIAAAVTCLNLLYCLLTVTGRFVPSFRWIQIGIDMFLWTLLIHFTGGKDSVFFLLYPLEILAATFTLSASGCVYGATLAGGFYTIDVGFLGSPPGLDNTHVVRLFFLLAIAALSVLIVRKLEIKTREVKTLSEMLRDRAERAETSLGAVLDTLDSGLLIVDEQGKVLSMNRPFAKMCGASDGKSSGEVVDGTALQQVRTRLLGLLNEGEKEKAIEFALSPDVERPGRLFLNTKIFERRGQRCIIAVATENGGEAEKNTELFQNADAGRADLPFGAGETAFIVAHEVRNSLTCIMGLLSLLGEDLSERSESIGLLKKAVGAAEDLNNFVSDLLLYSKHVEPRFEKADLVGIVDSMAEFVSMKLDGRKKITLARNVSVERLEAEVDPRHIQRVVMNLLINAYEAVEDSGNISLFLRQEDGNAVLEVNDDGCGIPIDSMNRIFEPFRTTKWTGGGLGLAITKKLIEAHGGQISVTSSLDGGTRFTVRVPLARQGPGISEGMAEHFLETSRV